MADPWEKYAAAPAQADGPWAQYADHSEVKATFGLGDTWPARIAKSIYSAVTAPGRVMQENPYPEGTEEHAFFENSRQGDIVNSSMDLAGIASPLSPAARVGVGWAGALKTEPAPAPTQQALDSVASAAYDKARKLAVTLPADGVSTLAGRISQHLQNEKGITADTAEKTFKVLDRLQDPPEGAVVTVPNLDALRRNFGEIAGNFNNPTDQKAAVIAKQHLSDYLASLTDKDAISGPASEVGALTREGNGNYAAARRSEQISEALKKAELQTAATHSGRNLDNKTRQAFVKILTDDKAGAGFTQPELDAAESIVRGSKSADLMRSAGNFLGGGGGLGALHSSSAGAAGGATVGGPIGAAIGAVVPPALGYLLKKGADASTLSKVEAFQRMVRARSPLADSLPDRVAGTVSPRQALTVRSLLFGTHPIQKDDSR